MIIALFNCGHWIEIIPLVPGAPTQSRVGEVVECLACSKPDEDTFRTVKIEHLFRIVRCAMNDQVVGTFVHRKGNLN